MADFPTVIFPDVEDALATHLRSTLPSYGEASLPVHMSVPSTRPDEFILLSVIGGDQEAEVVDRSNLLVEAWAQDPQRACYLARLARALIVALRGRSLPGTVIYRVEATSPVNLPDGLSNQYRYTFNVGVRCRGFQLIVALLSTGLYPGSFTFPGSLTFPGA